MAAGPVLERDQSDGVPAQYKVESHPGIDDGQQQQGLSMPLPGEEEDEEGTRREREEQEEWRGDEGAEEGGQERGAQEDCLPFSGGGRPQELLRRGRGGAGGPSSRGEGALLHPLGAEGLGSALPLLAAPLRLPLQYRRPLGSLQVVTPMITRLNKSRQRISLLLLLVELFLPVETRVRPIHSTAVHS